MRIDVRLFGPQARAARARSCSVELPDGATVADLLEALGREQPSLSATLPSSRVAVDHAFAEPNAVIEPGREVALIGAIDGG